VALAALLAACGGSSLRRSDAVCREQADKVAAHASSMLLHYRGGTVYPADMSYLGLQASLERYERAGCPKDTLGETLRRALTPRERRTLLGLLPRPSASRIRNALSAA
jgi:hypothetical protein